MRVTPARAFAIELRSLYDSVRGGVPITTFQVLEHLARAADHFASHTEHGVPEMAPEQLARLLEGQWRVPQDDHTAE